MKPSRQEQGPRFEIPLALLLVLAYANSLGNGFLMDDYTLIVDNNDLRDASPVAILQHGFGGFYRPLAFIFVKITILLFGHAVFGYHILNIALLFLSAMLFFHLLRELSGNRALAMLCVALWAAHPIHNGVVNYCTAGALTLAVIFMQAAALSFIKFARDGRAKALALSLMFYAFALLTHEMSFILPVYLFLIVQFFRYPVKNPPKILGAFAVVFLVYFLARSSILPLPHTLDAALTAGGCVTAFGKLVLWYLGKLAFPVDILLIWDVPVLKELGWQAVAFLGMLAAVAAVVHKFERNLYTFAMTAFTVGFIPAALAAFTYTKTLGTALFEPHWLMFASIWMFVPAAAWLLRFPKKVSTLFSLLILMTLTGLTAHHNTFWKTDDSYCSHWLSLNTLNGEPWHCKARAFLRKHDRGPDAGQYKSCKEISDVAGAYHLRRVEPMVLKYYDLALTKNMNCASAYYGLALHYADVESWSKADEHFRRAIQLDSRYAMYYNAFLSIEEKHKTDAVRGIRQLIGQDIF